MSFSRHEMLIFLRARDEASRTLGRFTRNAQTLNTKLVSTNNKLIASYQGERAILARTAASSKAASKEKVSAINRVLTAQKARLFDIRSEATAIQLAKRKEMQNYKNASAAISSAATSDMATSNKTMSLLKANHTSLMSSYDAELLKRQNIIAQKSGLINIIARSKTAEMSAAASTSASIDKQILKYKELERQVKQQSKTHIESARQQSAALQEKAGKLQATGMALSTVGAAATIMGVKTVSSLDDAAQAAIDYRKAATATLTQVDDQFKTSLNDIVDIGRKTADNFAVPIGDMQDAMYDLYSSMKVSDKGVAGGFMAEAAKAAVGGATDIKTATGSLISILNSYELKTSEVADVNNLMFQLVRKGVGSYSAFTKAMGTANSSAHRAGQSYRTTAAMLALMTRNGLNSAKAGTSSARAFDALSNPRTAKNMKEMGISIYDSSGKMKPMIKVIDMMKGSLKGLTQQQKSAKLKDMFAGSGGNFQAMRFFNIALNDSKGLYKDLYKDMKNASKVTDENGEKVGAAAIAYKQMSNTDMSKIIVAQNKMAIAWQKVGDAIMPVKTAVMEFFGQLSDQWNKLTPKQREGVVQFAAIAAVILVVGGAITTLVGIVLVLAGAFAALGVMASPIILTVLAIIAVIALLAAAAYLIITNWDAISKFFVDLWNGIVQWTTEAWNSIVSSITGAWDSVVTAVRDFGNTISKFFTDLWDGIVEEVTKAWDGVTQFFTTYWSTYLEPALKGMWETAQTYLATILAVIIALVTGEWDKIPAYFASAGEKILGFLTAGFAPILTLVVDIMTGVGNAISNGWNSISSGIQNKIGEIAGFVASLPGKMLAGLAGIAGVVSTAVGWFGDLKKGISDKANEAIAFVKSLPDKIKAALGNMGSLLLAQGKAVLDGFLDGLNYVWDNIKDMVGNIAGWIAAHKGPISKDKVLLKPHGRAVMESFNKSLIAGMNDTKRLIGNFNPELLNIGGGGAGLAYSTGAQQPSSNTTVNVNVNTQEINPVKHAADLGYEVAQRLGL